MSSRARKIAKRAVKVRICSASTVEDPCTREVRFAATCAFTACQHQVPGDPLPLCHPHAYAAQQQPIAPGIHACPFCRTLGQVALVRMTDA